MSNIEVKNGIAILENAMNFDGVLIPIKFSTKIPDGVYNQNDITFEISDGLRDSDFPVGCYVLHTKEYAKKRNIPVFI